MHCEPHLVFTFIVLQEAQSAINDLTGILFDLQLFFPCYFFFFFFYYVSSVSFLFWMVFSCVSYPFHSGKWLGNRQIRCNWAAKGAGSTDDKQNSDSQNMVVLTNGNSGRLVMRSTALLLEISAVWSWQVLFCNMFVWLVKAFIR